MGSCKIIDYTEEWRDKLRSYMHKTYPYKSSAYIEYCIDHASGRTPSLIVINDKGDVVGCHLYYCTTVKIKGEIVDTQWGHDTFLDQDYRADMGLDLILRIAESKSFGLGLTEINEKIQKKLKSVFFKDVYTYYTVTSRVLFSPFQYLFHTEPTLYNGETLKVGNYTFHKVSNVDEIDIPNEGYWFEGKDIDFIRDATFLKERFLENSIHHYIIYTCNYLDDNCYFVVRKTHYRGLSALTLSDYRYTNASMVRIILKAIKKIARRSNIGVILFVCGDSNMNEAIKGTLYHATPIDFVSNKRKVAGMSFCVTGADSDSDFLK